MSHRRLSFSTFRRFDAVVTALSALGLFACGGQGSNEAVPQDGAASSSAQQDATSNEAAPSDSFDDAAEASETTVDGNADALSAATDAGVPCGDASCGPSEICLYPACPPCAAGGGECQPPSCVPAGPGTGTWDCSGEDAASGCSFVNGPIPIHCSRTCHGFCA